MFGIPLPYLALGSIVLATLILKGQIPAPAWVKSLLSSPEGSEVEALAMAYVMAKRKELEQAAAAEAVQALHDTLKAKLGGSAPTAPAAVPNP